MTKAVRLIEENIKLVDAVIYVLDSRAVSACINPAFNSIIKNKPILYVFNKADLVEPSDLKKWCDYMDGRGYFYVTSNSASGRDNAKIFKKLLELMDEKIRRYREKGVNTPIRAMVIGIPNSGKSTLINSLCGGKKTVTGDKPGVTRNKQWLAVAKGVDMLDTPGTLWPKLDDQNIAAHLAYIGSIRDDVLDISDIAVSLIGFLLENRREALTARYGVSAEGGALETFEEIALKRGYVLKGGVTDYERASRAVLDDFRKQKLGKIMLEFPNDGIF